MGGKARGGRRGWDPLATGSANLFWAKIGGNGGYFVAVLIVARGLGPAGRGTVAFITVAALVVAHVSGLGVGEATMVLSARQPERRPVLLANAMVFFLGTGFIAATLAFLGLALSGIEPAGVGTPGARHPLARNRLLRGRGSRLLLSHRRGAAAPAGVHHRLRVLGLRGARVRALGGPGPHRRPGGAGLDGHRGAACRRPDLALEPADDLGLPDRRLLVEEIGFGLRLWVGSLARFLNFRTDQILMGFLTTEAALGFYAVAVNVSEVLLYLPSSAATALLPLIARTEPARRGQETLRAFRSVIFVTAAGAAVAALLGPSCYRPCSATPSTSRSSRSCGCCRARSATRPAPSSRAPLSDRPHPACRPWGRGVARRRLRPRSRADTALRGDGSGGRGQRGVPGRRRGGAAHVSPREPVPVADDARPHRGDLDVLAALAGPLRRARPRRETA